MGGVGRLVVVLITKLCFFFKKKNPPPCYEFAFIYDICLLVIAVLVPILLLSTD